MDLILRELEDERRQEVIATVFETAAGVAAKRAEGLGKIAQAMRGKQSGR
jgi:hypothetical protein